MIDDRILLQRYATHGDEAAFAEIVRRHLPYVYSAAVRRLGQDARFAADVSQGVFCALARDAHAVARHSTISGWLFTATRNAVTNIVRGEKRRRLREAVASEMQQMDSEPHITADWARLRPVLDSALDRLTSTDRDAVLLRYIEGRSFGEVGAILGSSEDAARKRTERALNRLRDLLRPRDAVQSSATLAGLLAAHGVTATPAGLVARATEAALSTGGAAALGVTTFMTITKLQAGFAAALVVAATIGVILQQRTITRLRSDIATAPWPIVRSNTQVTANPREATNIGGNRLGAADPLTSAPAGDVLAATALALQNGKLPQGYFAFARVLEQLTPENWREVQQAFNEERKRTGLGHPRLVEVFVRRAGEVAGREALQFFLQDGWPGEANEAMVGWASKNPAEALQWLGHDADVETRRKLMGAAIRGLALTEPDLAVKTLEDQPASERAGYTTELVTSALRTVGIEGAQRLVEGVIARATENGRLGERYVRNLVYDYSSMRVYQAMASGTLSDALGWMSQRVGEPYFDQGVITEVTRRLALENPQEAFRWLEGVNDTRMRGGETTPTGYRMLLEAWTATQGASTVETWLRGQETHSQYDYLAEQYAGLVAPQDMKKALGWANTIKDATIKEAALQLINRRGRRDKS